jgi:biotin carboxylase
MRADDPDGFRTAFERLRALLQTPDIRAERNEAHNRVLVEEFIPGREFALEGLLHHGRLQTLALFDKPDPLDGPFFEETIYVTPPRTSDQLKTGLTEAVTRAAWVIGLTHGPIHAECRVNAHGVFMLEVAARPIGGLCARALRFGRRQPLSDTAPEETADTTPPGPRSKSEPVESEIRPADPNTEISFEELGLSPAPVYTART